MERSSTDDRPSESTFQRKSTDFFKIPLKSTQQIYLIFLAPALISCFVYVINFAADFVTGVQHLRAGDQHWAIVTFALMYAPSLVYFAITISRPHWWMTEDDKLTKGTILWLAKQIFQSIFFPLFALYRYNHHLVQH